MLSLRIAGALLCLALAACASTPQSGVPATPSSTAAAADAHSMAIRRMLIAADYYTEFAQGMRQRAQTSATGPKSAQQRAYMACALKNFSESRVMDKLLPVYRKHYTQQEAETVAAFLESPMGQAARKKDWARLMQFSDEAHVQKMVSVLPLLERHRSAQMSKELEAEGVKLGIEAGISCLSHLTDEPAKTGVKL